VVWTAGIVVVVVLANSSLIFLLRVHPRNVFNFTVSHLYICDLLLVLSVHIFLLLLLFLLLLWLVRFDFFEGFLKTLSLQNFKYFTWSELPINLVFLLINFFNRLFSWQRLALKFLESLTCIWLELSVNSPEDEPHVKRVTIRNIEMSSQSSFLLDLLFSKWREENALGNSTLNFILRVFLGKL
jgi:uncharacterized membrane-anchored protein YitT (DUF2179 family)